MGFLMRNTQWSRDLLSGAWKIFPALGFDYEQSSLIAMLGGANPNDPQTWKPAFKKLLNVSMVSDEGVQKIEGLLSPEMKAHVKFLKQSSMDSGVGIYAQGDFIFHAAGKSME